MKNDGKSIFEFYKSTSFQLLYIGLIPLGVIAIWGESIFHFVFGSSWGEAGIYAAILSPWLFIGFINPPSMINFYILKLNHIQLIMQVFLLIFRILAIYIGYAIYSNVYYSIALFSLAGVIINLVMIVYIYYKLKKV